MSRKRKFGSAIYVEDTITRNWDDANYAAEKLRSIGVLVKITKEPPTGRERKPWYFVWQRLY